MINLKDCRVIPEEALWVGKNLILDYKQYWYWRNQEPGELQIDFTPSYAMKSVEPMWNLPYGRMIDYSNYRYKGSKFAYSIHGNQVQLNNWSGWKTGSRIIEPDPIIGEFLICENWSQEMNITIVQPGRQTVYVYCTPHNPESYNEAIKTLGRRYDRKGSGKTYYKEARKYTTFGYQVDCFKLNLEQHKVYASEYRKDIYIEPDTG